MTDFIQITVTVGNNEEAQEISRRLVEDRLAACVQISGPINSRYWWKGVIETAQEWVCTIKTKAALYSSVEKTVRSIHSYDVPEIISLPILSGSGDYMEWLGAETLDVVK